jgi:ABC-type transport system involved in cytochrome bd biosynthesis fused ATPase/permease subunit
MKAIRRFGFIIFVLLIGIMIGNFSPLTVMLIVCPLFTLWMILWDDKKFRQAERKYHRQLMTKYYHYE